jgi:hypothetical protein
MSPDVALKTLTEHADPEVRAAAFIVRDSVDRRRRIIDLIQECVAQLRLDIKYLMYDLECTKRERDAALAKLGDT